MIDEKNARHIFREQPGHLADTPTNRQLLEETASNPTYFLGTDKYGNDWYAKTLSNGTQVWTQVRKGQIRNCGLNNSPRQFHPQTGFSSPTKPGQS